MNIGVEVLKESVIRVQSQLNDWMDKLVNAGIAFDAYYADAEE